MQITVETLKQIAPGGKQTNFKLFPELVEWMNFWFPKFEIDSKGELCHFLAQAAHETNSFNTLEEYASGNAYEKRIDLGNVMPGDGKRFKGRGIFQCTGRGQYKSLTITWDKTQPEGIDFEEHPDLLLDSEYGVWSACQYWDDRDFNTTANRPDSDKIWSKKLNRNLSPLEYISFRINGGFNGLKERTIFYERAKSVLG